MDYKEGLKELFPLVKEVWEKVDSGFYPEIDQEIKVLNATRMFTRGRFKESFWYLLESLLLGDLIPMAAGVDLSKETEKISKLLEGIKDQEKAMAARTKLELLQKKALSI